MVICRRMQQAMKHDVYPTDSDYRHPYQVTQAPNYMNFTVWLLLSELQTDTLKVCEYCVLLGM